jgi:transposase-like protein
MVSFKGAHFGKDLMLTCVRWYAASPLSARHVEALRQAREGAVDRGLVHRWGLT